MWFTDVHRVLACLVDIDPRSTIVTPDLSAICAFRNQRLFSMRLFRTALYDIIPVEYARERIRDWRTGGWRRLIGLLESSQTETDKTPLFVDSCFYCLK